MTAQSRQSWLPNEENGSGHSYGSEELANLAKVMESGVLIASRDGFTRQLEIEFAERYGVSDAITCSSLTISLQAVLAVAGLPPGSEVLTTPLSDIGGISPIVQEGFVSVFVDVDPITGNIDPASVEAAISERTSAIVVTHLVGKPCDMKALMEIAQRRGLVVIEDCAQAYDARYDGQLVGTFGIAGCFSTQQSKHIASGEGGLIITDDPALALQLRSWTNKGVEGGVRSRSEDHPIVGMNARMTELQAAVLVPQLHRLDEFVAARIERAEQLSAALSDLDGITPPITPENEVQTYWKYMLSIDPDIRPGFRDRLADELEQRKAIVLPGYLHLPLFAKTLFKKHPRRLVGQAEASLLDPERPDHDLLPGMQAFIQRALVLYWNERIEEADVMKISDLIHQMAEDDTARNGD